MKCRRVRGKGESHSDKVITHVLSLTRKWKMRSSLRIIFPQMLIISPITAKRIRTYLSAFGTQVFIWNKLSS